MKRILLATLAATLAATTVFAWDNPHDGGVGRDDVFWDGEQSHVIGDGEKPKKEPKGKDPLFRVRIGHIWVEIGDTVPPPVVVSPCTLIVALDSATIDSLVARFFRYPVRRNAPSFRR